MKVKLDETNTSVIACEMIEDEVKEAMRRSVVHYPVQWVERGYHNIPEKLHAILQERIARAEGSFLEGLTSFWLSGSAGRALPDSRLPEPIW